MTVTQTSKAGDYTYSFKPGTVVNHNVLEPALEADLAASGVPGAKVDCPLHGEGEDRGNLHLHRHRLGWPTEPADVQLQQRRWDDRRVVRHRRLDHGAVARADGPVTFVGHSTVLLELGGVRLLTDPVLRPGFAHIKRHAAPPAAGVTERVDAVLLSHLHADHVDLPSLRSFARDVRLIAPRRRRTIPAP